LKKIFEAGLGFLLMMIYLRSFDPKKIFENKTVAIVGPAASAFDENNGEYINSFDIVVRFNKAIVNWDSRKEKYIGNRTDILIHSFLENNETGGGKLDLKLFQEHGLKYLINAKNNRLGYRRAFNFYKKYLNRKNVFILSKKYFLLGKRLFGSKYPTNGFWGLFMVFKGKPKKVFVTGFTFFKTPYADGYRDNLKDVKHNNAHIKESALHDPDLEFSIFLELLKEFKGEIDLDDQLEKIVNINK